MLFSKKVLENIFDHALAEYPDECCGIVTGAGNSQTVHLCRNIQNKLHHEDPRRHPRDAKTAYMIDRDEAEQIIASSREKSEQVLAFYHSHTNHEAYFSITDVEAQTVFGEPEFPDAVHIVVSVIKNKIHDIKGFKWDRESNDFLTVTI